jgi:Acetyltransferase (GNAT) domain
MPLATDEKKLAPDSRCEEVLYRNGVPAFAPTVLSRLYGSLYGMLPALQAIGDNSAQGIFTYVRRYISDRAAQIDILLMFRQEDCTVRVLNEGMALEQTSIDAFCRHVFATMPGTAQIEFHAIALPARCAPQNRSTGGSPVRPPGSRPCLCWPCTEDIVIRLPDSPQSYLSELGKATRKSIRKHLSRARQQLPGFAHHVIPGTALDDTVVRQIVSFNHARMAQQGRASAIDEQATRELISLMRSCGEAGVIVSGTTLCAGTLACRVGDDVFSLVNAHDPRFDHLGLGKVCRHLTILQAISTGAQRFHLLGGNLPAKRATRAERQPLYHLTVYRTRLAMLRDATGIARHAGNACRFWLHCRFEDQQAVAPSGWLGRVIGALRKRRHALLPANAPAAPEALR